MLKLCCKCKRSLAIDLFYVIRGKPSSPCKRCIAIKSRLNAPQKKAYMEEWRKTYEPPQDAQWLSAEYGIWIHMRQRCLNPNNDRFKDYGGRGIGVCERWASFNNFLADMGPRPEGTSLDRFPDFNGNYEPGNCRWATPKEQQNNMRGNSRLRRGWTIEQALTLSNRKGMKP